MTAEPMIVYAVRYSNYDPPEISSLWLDKEMAEKECQRLNDRDIEHGYSGMWEISPMTVNEKT